MKTFAQLNEVLTDTQKAAVAKWPSATVKSRVATDHFFGKGVDDKHTPLDGTVDKSEIHKRIERHLGKEIHSDDYKAGKTTDEHGREVKIGKLLAKTKADDETKRGFENDSTRQAKKHKGLSVRTTRSAEGVAGQTSGNQSWEQQSCKNFDTGSNKKYLKPEVKHGTVVSYLHDENGKEIARCTHQPHHNEEGHTMYATDSHYGVDHAGFKKHCEQVNKQLSGPHKGGSVIYKKHEEVYNDSDQKIAVHPAATEEDLHTVLNHENAETRAGALSSPNVTAAHIHKALDDGNAYVRITAAGHPKATAEHLHKALNDENIYPRIAAARHPNANSDHLHAALKDKKPGVRQAAAGHPNATADHLDKALKDEDTEVRIRAAANPNATAEHLNKALNDEHSDVRAAAATHPNATAEHLDKASNDKNDWVREAAASHPNATAEHLHKASNDKEGEVRATAASHPNATAEHLHKALNDEERSVRIQVARHPNATAEHLHKALNDENKYIRAAAAAHPNASSEHLNKALNDKEPVVRENAAAHPNATAEHLHKAFNDFSPIVRDAAEANPNAKKFGLIEGISVKTLFATLSMAG